MKYSAIGHIKVDFKSRDRRVTQLLKVSEYGGRLKKTNKVLTEKLGMRKLLAKWVPLITKGGGSRFDSRTGRDFIHSDLQIQF